VVEQVLGIDRPVTQDMAWVLVNAYPEFDGARDVLQVVATFVGITRRRMAEENLRISEERHRLLAENARDVVWTMSVDGRITYVSPSVEKMRGFTAAEAMLQSIEEIHPPASRAISLGYFTRLNARIQAGLPPESFRGELEYRCKDGSTIWTEVFVIVAETTVAKMKVGTTYSPRQRVCREASPVCRADEAETPMWPPASGRLAVHVIEGRAGDGSRRAEKSRRGEGDPAARVPVAANRARDRSRHLPEGGAAVRFGGTRRDRQGPAAAREPGPGRRQGEGVVPVPPHLPLAGRPVEIDAGKEDDPLDGATPSRAAPPGTDREAPRTDGAPFSRPARGMAVPTPAYLAAGMSVPCEATACQRPLRFTKTSVHV
jgi:PAS domain S-box-containing protein